jgi:hypothetical protein
MISQRAIYNRSYQFADLQAATGVDKDRFQQWIKNGKISFLDDDRPGLGQRRLYHCFDIYQCRLIVALINSHLPISDAIAIVNEAAYSQALLKVAGHRAVADGYRYYQPDEYRHEAGDPATFLVARRSPSLGWLVNFATEDASIADVLNGQRQSVADEGGGWSVEKLPVAIVLNIKNELAAVDDELRKRLPQDVEN